jgi:nucleotide-binding universal stress UspA family protein
MQNPVIGSLGETLVRWHALCYFAIRSRVRTTQIMKEACMSIFTKEKIIVPWDFSEMSKTALARAVELAESNEQVEVVHVTPYPAAMEPSVVWGAYSEDNIRENLEKSFRKEIPDDQYPGIKFNALFGDPGSEITRVAKELNAGLVVISSHGRTGIERLLMGSVAERVVRMSPCPVLVLRVAKK